MIARYLTSFDLSPSFRELYDAKDKNYSFVFSNGAFSEMRGNLIEDYYQKVIEKSSSGYFLCNFHTHSEPYGGWTASYFLERLKKSGKKNPVMIEDISGFVSPFDNGSSVLVLFGFDDPLVKLRTIEYPSLYNYIDRAIDKFKRALT
jgi:hypothetical protein